MKIFLHDDTPAGPGEEHGEDGPTHCGSVRVDYEYQAEMWVAEIEQDHAKVVRVWVPDLRREWLRVEGKFVEQKPALSTEQRRTLVQMGSFLEKAQEGCPPDLDLREVAIQALTSKPA